MNDNGQMVFLNECSPFFGVFTDCQAQQQAPTAGGWVLVIMGASLPALGVLQIKRLRRRRPG